MITIKNLDKSFGDHHVLDHLSLTIKEGETIAIIGPSGSGKSTLLRCLNLLEQPESGEVTVGSVSYHAPGITRHDCRQIRQVTAMVFQNYDLFANLTVLHNITMPLIVGKKKSKEDAQRMAYDLLKKVDLSDKANAYPDALSGGQQQRVAIARALALHPEVMLFDEPTSALDPELVQGVLDVIRDVAKAQMTSIIVTHEMAFARDVADRVIFMDGGRIIEQGPAYELITNPQQERTKQFLNRFLEK